MKLLVYIGKKEFMAFMKTGLTQKNMKKYKWALTSPPTVPTRTATAQAAVTTRFGTNKTGQHQTAFDHAQTTPNDTGQHSIFC